MTTDRIFWTAYTHGEYHAALFSVEEIIGRHGFITHFNLISDLSVSFRIETDATHINALAQDLQTVVRLEAEWPEHISGETIIFLQLNFSSGKGDKRHEIPAVPG